MFLKQHVSLSAERVLESLEQKGDGNDSMSSGDESESVRIKVRGYSIREQEAQRKKERATQRSAANFYRHCFACSLLRPSIAFSCRVRVGERATKKDHDRFIRTRVARARTLRVAAYQASCGGYREGRKTHLSQICI